jgi:hypothetical protein
VIELKKIENLYIQRAIVRTNITKTLNKGSAYMFINNGEENTVNDIRNFLSKKTKFVPFGNIKTVVTPNTDIATFNSSTIMRIKNNRAETIKKFKTELPEISNVKLDASQTQNLNAISYIPWYFELSQKYNREDKSIKLFSAILENFRRQFYIPTKFGDKTKEKYEEFLSTDRIKPNSLSRFIVRQVIMAQFGVSLSRMSYRSQVAYIMYATCLPIMEKKENLVAAMLGGEQHGSINSNVYIDFTGTPIEHNERARTQILTMVRRGYVSSERGKFIPADAIALEVEDFIRGI